MGEDYVALLGTKGGPAIRTGSTMPTSSLVCMDGHAIVVDCGLGVTRGLVDQGIRLKDLSLICITHLHSDHYLELGPLLHTAWTAGLKSGVEVWGPPGLADYWTSFLQSMEADISIRIEDEGRPDLAALVSINVIEEGRFLDKGDLSISALRNEHPPLVDTFALRLRTAGRHVVFSGDTAYLPELAAFAKDADLLIHEAMLEPALGPLLQRIGNGDGRLMKHWLRSHTFAHEAARVAASANAKALALHHLIPSDDPDFTRDHWLEAVSAHYSGEVHIGTDGIRIPL
ncbi:MAG: MBL fold metallo-hydrolase [Pseudomonadota bacterium]